MDEERWRLKSCAIWLSQGDQNTKFSIILQTTEKFKFYLGIFVWRRRSGDISSTYFQRGCSSLLCAILRSWDVFDYWSDGYCLKISWVFIHQEGAMVVDPMTLDEVKFVLRGFEKSKSPSPDARLNRWTIFGIFLYHEGRHTGGDGGMQNFCLGDWCDESYLHCFDTEMF